MECKEKKLPNMGWVPRHRVKSDQSLLCSKTRPKALHVTRVNQGLPGPTWPGPLHLCDLIACLPPLPPRLQPHWSPALPPTCQAQSWHLLWMHLLPGWLRPHDHLAKPSLMKPTVTFGLKWQTFPTSSGIPNSPCSALFPANSSTWRLPPCRGNYLSMYAPHWTVCSNRVGRSVCPVHRHSTDNRWVNKAWLQYFGFPLPFSLLIGRGKAHSYPSFLLTWSHQSDGSPLWIKWSWKPPH